MENSTIVDNQTSQPALSGTGSATGAQSPPAGRCARSFARRAPVGKQATRAAHVQNAPPPPTHTPRAGAMPQIMRPCDSTKGTFLGPPSGGRAKGGGQQGRGAACAPRAQVRARFGVQRRSTPVKHTGQQRAAAGAVKRRPGAGQSWSKMVNAGQTPPSAGRQ